MFEAVSFSVEPGEILHIKGPNGAGKTSLLRIIVGLSQSAEGQVYFRDMPLEQATEQLHSQLVYFGHKPGLNPALSAMDNLRFWADMHGVPIDRSHLFDLLGRLGLVGLEELRVGQLSAGQQRRVALCRLWLKRKARVWVLDEPFTALDVQGIAVLKAQIDVHLSNQGCIIMTSHQDIELNANVSTLELEYRI